MLSAIEIQKILETITAHHTENEKITQSFRKILIALDQSLLPKCKNDTTHYLSFEEIQAQEISAFNVNPILRPEFSSPSASSPISQEMLVLNESPRIQTIEPKPEIFLTIKPKFLNEFQKSVLAKAFSALKPHGFTREMLKNFILNSHQRFVFKTEQLNTLIFLVTGHHPLSSSYVYPAERLSPEGALAEIKDLNIAQLGALDRLFPLKLNANLLRSFSDTDDFTHYHGVALNYLMRKPDISLPAENAIERIQGLDLQAIKKLIRTLKNSTLGFSLSPPKNKMT